MLDAGWWLIPISGDIHWTLAAIRGLKKPNFDENDPVLTMLHFNSLLPGTGTHDSTTIARNLSAVTSVAFFISKHAQEHKASMEETVQHFQDVKVEPANYQKRLCGLFQSRTCLSNTMVSTVAIIWFALYASCHSTSMTGPKLGLVPFAPGVPPSAPMRTSRSCVKSSRPS